MGGPLVIVMDIMIFQSLLLDVINMFVSTVSCFAQLDLKLSAGKMPSSKLWSK